MNPLGHSSPVFCHDPIEATASRIRGDGFDVWEVVAEGDHDLALHRQAFQDALDTTGLRLQVHAPISDCNLGSLVAEARALAVESTRRTLKAAASLGVELVTVHPGNHTPLSRGHYDALHEATRRSLRQLAGLADDLGIALCLENVPNNWAFETDSVEKVLDLIDGTEMGLCFDLGHAYCAKRLDEFPAVAHRLRNVHLHDNRGDHDAHLTLDEGTLPWRQTMGTVLASGYQGPIVIESNSHASGRSSLEKYRAWAAKKEDAPAQRGREKETAPTRP